MKDSKTILKHLNIPHKDKFDTHRCLNLIVSFLPKIYQKYIIRTYLKNSTLFIVTSHQGLNQELNHKFSTIKSLLGIIKTKNKCMNITITNLKIYSEIPKKTTISKNDKILKFYIHNVKDFKIQAKNPKIIAKFEEIKNILREKSE